MSQACFACMIDYTDTEQGCDTCAPLKPAGYSQPLDTTPRRLGRDDGWVRNEPGHLSNGAPAFMHVADEHDISEGYSTFPTGYDSRCGWCYLGAPHSLNAHAAHVRRFSEYETEASKHVLDTLPE